MASRTFQFFSTIEETWNFVRMLIAQHGLRVYLHGLRDKEAHEWLPSNPPVNNLLFPAHIYFSDQSQPVDIKSLRGTPNGKADVVELWFDGAERNRLYMNDLGVKSDWSEDEQYYDNPSVLELHRRLKATLKKQLRHGVLISDAAGRGVEPRTGIWLSPGAIAFHAAGGELMQAGSENVRFAPLPEEASSASKPSRPPRDSARRKR